MKTFLFIAKSPLTRALASLALGSALIGLHGSAMALTTEHGSICKPYGNSNTAGLFSSIYGVGNYSGGALSIICPVVRTVPAPAGGYSVWVDGKSAASDTTSCSLYSINYDGSYLGVASFSAPGPTFTRLLTLPQSQVPFFSSQSVYCYVPNNGSITDIEPVQ
jgi:hypothetical protein